MDEKRYEITLPLNVAIELEKAAQKVGCSVDRLIRHGIMCQIDAIRGEDFFRERAARADRAKALEFLDRAGNGNPPMPGDELPEGFNS